ncbi:MAG TPA: hypothetical protein VIX37_10125, partial [Candidatus Sulfotelmatobacter sp.]
LRSGFHHDFLDGAFLQPCRQFLQFGDRGTKPTTLELQFPVSGICNYNVSVRPNTRLTAGGKRV